MHSIRLGWGLAVVVAVLSAPVWAGPDASDTPPLDPDRAVRAALLHNTSVLQAQGSLLLAQGQLAQSLGANPTVSGNALVGGPSVVSVSQPVSLTGQGVAMRASASARVQSAQDTLRRTELEVAHQARSAYVDAVVAVRIAEVAQEGLSVSERLSQAVRRLSEEGEVSRLELDLVQLGQAQSATRLLDATSAQADALVALAAVLSQPVTPDALTPTLSGVVPTPSRAGDGTRSDVAAAQAALIAAERDVGVSRKAALPPLGLGAQIQVEGDEVLAGPTLSMELPVFNRNQADRAAAQGQLGVAESQLLQAEALATTERETAQARDTLAVDTLESLGEAPAVAAERALSAVEAGYLAGEIDLIQAVLLQAQILDGETAVVQLEGHVAQARLDLLLATDDSALLGGAQ